VIVLDTNVVSELMRIEPDTRVTAWLNGFSPQDLSITAISISELRFGIEIHASGRRRAQLEENLARILDGGFHDRILNFDDKAAEAAAIVSARQRLKGRSREIRDTLISGIVVSQRADFATRNVRHFEDLAIRVIDPWRD
jgi:toxin FitB